MGNKITYVILSILVGVLGWSWTTTYSKLAEIEKSLIELKIGMVKVETQMIDREAVKEIVNDELLKHNLIK